MFAVSRANDKTNVREWWGLIENAEGNIVHLTGGSRFEDIARTLYLEALPRRKRN